MEQAQNTRTQAPTQGVSPLKAAATLLLIIALAAAAWSFAGRSSDPASTRAPLPQAPAVPSEQEIIAEFKRLDALRIQAFETVDPSLISKIAYPGSPYERLLTEGLQLFLRKEVVPRIEVRVHDMRVTQVDSQSATVLQVITETARFRAEDGRDVTVTGGPFRQKISWVLRRNGVGWRIFDAVARESQRVRP